MTSPNPQAVQALMSLLAQGRLSQCEAKAREMTRQFADDAAGWKALGLCLVRMERFGEAAAVLQRAASLQPGDCGSHNNLGNVLNSLGRYAEAEQAYRRSLALKPEHPQANFNLGITLTHLSRPAEAEACFRRAAALMPEAADVHYNLGVTLTHLGRPAEAEACFRRAAALMPEAADVHFSLGNVQTLLGRLGEGEASYRRALALRPDHVEVLNNLGTLLNSLGQPAEAERCFRRVLTLRPDSVEACNNLGNTLHSLGRLADAESCFKSALALQPDYAEALNNLGNLLNALGRATEAETCFRRAVDLKPDDASTRNNLGNALKELGRLAEAEASYRHALTLKPDNTETYSNLLFCLNYRDDAAELAWNEALEYGRLVNGLVASRYKNWLCEAAPKRFRVGFVSADLGDHVVGFFLENLLRELNAGLIEPIAYPTQFIQDQRLRRFFSEWRPIAGLTDAAAAERIHADGIHVLVDLSGHTAHNRLPVFAYRPAPVQATWLGYLATTGVTAMDYLIADSTTLPGTEEKFFSEKIWRLPHTYLCFTPPEIDVDISPLPALNEKIITFGSFNYLAKMTDAVVALWAQVLKAVPPSRLYLKTRQLKEASVRKDIVRRFAVHGIEGERLVLEGPVPDRARHLAAYHKMDVALDTFPYPGITTTAEALWMGVPVLTLAGKSFLSRQGAGLAMNAGLREWIADSPEDYLERAVSHTGDLERLAALRASLRQRLLTGPICDARAFARHFEQAVEKMWHNRTANK